MKRPRSVIAASVLAATAITVAAAAQASSSPDPADPTGPGVAGAVTTLANSVAPFATVDRLVAAVPAASKLTVQFWLAPQAAAAASFANAVSTPGNPEFRHFLSPAAYTSRFGASLSQAATVQRWLKAQGFSGATTDPGRDYVRATATAAAIDKALNVQLSYYKATAGASAGKFPLRANDRAFSLPVSVAKDVTGVTGLDNAAPVMTYKKPGDPAATKKGKADSSTASFACSQWYAQHFASGLPKQFGITK